jgi:glycosyltransferase involved in cell wall biosynthesis
LQRYGVNINKIRLLPVGIDNDHDKPIDNAAFSQVSDDLGKSEHESIFLYLGSLKPIRGFKALLDAFPDVVRRNGNARLVILARGAEQEQCDAIMDELRRNGTDTNISIIGGWLTKDQVLSYIELSDVVTLPFILVPSDIPVAVLESLARGRPVVVSPVDGLSELAEGRGAIVDPLDRKKFSEELYDLSQDRERIERYADSARTFIVSYPRWHDVGRIMDEICDNDIKGGT